MRTTKKGKFFLYLILTLGALLILFPMYITITTTFKTPAESAVSFFTLPKSLYLGNYATVLQDEKLYYAYGNTILITVVSLLGEMLILPPMGFALSRGMKQNRFFKGLYFFFLLGIFLPKVCPVWRNDMEKLADDRAHAAKMRRASLSAQAFRQ